MKPAPFVLAVAAIAGAAFFYLRTNDRAEIEARAKAAQEDAVAVLPRGTEDAWIAYVDERLKRALKRQGNSVLLEELMPAFGQVLVSINTPYTISCSPLEGGTITFGFGNDSHLVPIYGILVFDTLPKPSLGVSVLSIAAQNLHKVLCDRIERATALTMSH